jgi:hypothetical protein
MLRALADAKQIELFEVVMNQYVEYCDHIGDRSKFGFAIASICSSLSRGGRNGKSLALYNQFYSPKNPQYDLSLYASQRAINCCFEERNLPLALRYTIEVIIEGLNIDHLFGDSIIRIASEIKRYDIVCRLFELFESNSNPIELYEIMKQLPNAKDEISTLHQHYPDLEAQLRSCPPLLVGHKRKSYVSIISALSRCDAHQEAIDLFERIRHEPLFQSNPCLKTCINAIAACCLSQQYGLAIKYYHLTTSIGKILC